MRNRFLKWISSPKSDRILQAIGIVYALSVCAITMYLNRAFYHDDAYITLRYARNFISGLGMTWNPGEYVQGYTNFLHLMLVSFLGRLGIDLVLASRIIGIISLAGLFGLALLFGILTKKEHGGHLWHLPLMLVATSVSMVIWSIGGLEGPLLSFLIAGGSLLFLLALRSPNNYWLYGASGFSFALSYLTRPDSVIIIFISLGWLFLAIRSKRSYKFLDAVAFAAGLAIIVIPYVIWQVVYYGDVFPNTYYVKVGVPLWLRRNTGFRYILDYLIHPPYLPIAVLGSLVYTARRRLWNAKVIYLTLAVFSYCLYIFLVGGDHMPSFRLLLPVMPLLAAILTIALAPAVKSNGRLIANCITIGIIILTCLQLFDNKLNPRREDPASRVGTIIGKYIADAWPQGSLVALNTAGSTPYYAGQNRYIDMLGLNDTVIARRAISVLQKDWQMVPGHCKGDGAYVLSRRPDFIIIGPAAGARACRSWFLSDLEISRDPSFYHDYTQFVVFLDHSGRTIAKPVPATTDIRNRPIFFIYYKRTSGQNEAVIAQPATTDSISPHR